MVYEVRQTEEFARWMRKLRDRRARTLIAVRITRAQAGLLGDAKVFDGIGELRIPYGPGYRVYFMQRGKTVIVLLCGGDKGSQRRDIERAKRLAVDL